MKNIRLYFSKTGDARFLSHLDVMRCFTRAVKRTGLDVWYTQGFNCHMYLMFSSPISLGFESCCESVDLRLMNDSDLEKDIARMVNEGLPAGICVLKVEEPSMKHTDIQFSKWQITFPAEAGRAETIKKKLDDFFASDSIPVVRKTKRGEYQEDAIPFIKSVKYHVEGETCILEAVLAGNVDRALNPKVLLTAFGDSSGVDTEMCRIRRLDIYDKNLNSFC